MAADTERLIRAQELQFGQHPWLRRDIDDYNDVLTAAHFPEHSGFTLRRMYMAAAMLTFVESLDEYPDEVRDILDFGSGSGNSLLAVDDFAQEAGARITATESDEHKRAVLQACVDSGVLSRVVRVESNGLDVMRTEPGAHDLIIASWLEHSEDEFAGVNEQFMDSVGAALRPGGMAAIYSASDTMELMSALTDRLGDGVSTRLTHNANLQARDIGGENNPYMIISRSPG